jgi:hypothetical protein
LIPVLGLEQNSVLYANILPFLVKSLILKIFRPKEEN